MLVILAAAVLPTFAYTSPLSCSSSDAECVLASAHGTPSWVSHFSTQSPGPEQFHVNYGPSPDSMAIRWTTNSSAATALVHWGVSAGSLNETALGLTDRYVYSAKYTSPWIHTTNLTGLPLGTRIYYQVGDAASGVSPVMSFMSNPGVGPIYPYRTGSSLTQEMWGCTLSCPTPCTTNAFQSLCMVA